MTTLEVPIRNGLTHWHIDVLGGTPMENTRRGNLDSAVYTVDAGGKITIPVVDHGDYVSYIRGVYTTSSIPNWHGFWAYMFDGSGTAVNYYDSHVFAPGSGEAIITLNAAIAPGTQLQVYYLYDTDQVTSRYTYVQAYPSLFKAAGGPYPQEVIDSSPGLGKFSSASDSDEMFVMACHEAYLALGDSKYEELARTIIQALRTYDIQAVDYSYYDTMDYALFSQTIGWYYAVGDVQPTMTIVLDPTNSLNQVLKIVSTASVYSIVGKLGSFAVSSSNNFIFDFIGEFSGDIYLVEICNDPGRADDIAKRYYCAFRDFVLYKTSFTFPVNTFRTRKNVAFSDISNTYSGAYKGATAWQSPSVTTKPIVESTAGGDIIHYTCIKNAWDFTQCYESPGEYCYPDPEDPENEICEPIPPPVSDAYAGVFVTFDSSKVNSANYSDVNFYVSGTVSGTYRLIVKDAHNVQFYKDVPISSAGRITVSFSSLAYYTGGSGSESITHPLYQVYFEAKNSPMSGTFFVWDVKFGQHDFLSSYDISLWQFKLPTGNRTIYLDNVGFDHVIVDAYKGAPFFSYQWSSAGKDAWFGPTYTAYVMPGIYHIMGYADTALVQMKFMKDAQDGYKAWYGGSYGPFLPVHTRTRIENTEYGTMNTFTWGSPNGDTHWGGYMYRAFEQVARYYYYTGNADAKTVLDRWVSWLNANIIEDVAFPGTPKGYLPPAQYTQWTGTWDYAYYSPDFHALIVQGMVFKYWRDGDAVANTWYRRLLDDLVYNRADVNGSYPQGLKTYGFHQGEVGKALGMLINGRKGATPAYSLTATTDDKNAFEALYAYFYNGVGYSKPCSLSPEWLPMHQRETVVYGPNEKKWVIDAAALTEGISICMYFAADYAYYDQTAYGQKWLERLYRFLYVAVIGDKEWPDEPAEEYDPYLHGQIPGSDCSKREAIPDFSLATGGEFLINPGHELCGGSGVLPDFSQGAGGGWPGAKSASSRLESLPDYSQGTGGEFLINPAHVPHEMPEALPDLSGDAGGGWPVLQDGEGLPEPLPDFSQSTGGTFSNSPGFTSCNRSVKTLP